MNIKYLNPNKSYSEYGVFSLDAIENSKSISVVAFSDINTIYNKEISREIQLIPTFYFLKTSTNQIILRENWSRRII